MPLKGLLLIIFSFTIFSSVKAQQNQFHFGVAAGKEGFITFPHLTYYRFTRSDSLQNSRFFMERMPVSLLHCLPVFQLVQWEAISISCLPWKMLFLFGRKL